MSRTSRISIVPAVVALAALFAVLPQRGADAEVRMVARDGGWGFSPQQVEIEPGDRIAFVNESGVTHTATCEGCPWDTGDVQPGQTAMITFDTQASSRFSCRYHAGMGMTGRLLVGGAPLAEPQPSPTT